jgi:hypothetical protein
MFPNVITRGYPRPRINLGMRKPPEGSFIYWELLDDARRAVHKLEWQLLLNSAGVGSSKKEER